MATALAKVATDDFDVDRIWVHSSQGFAIKQLKKQLMLQLNN